MTSSAAPAICPTASGARTRPGAGAAGAAAGVEHGAQLQAQRVERPAPGRTPRRSRWRGAR